MPANRTRLVRAPVDVNTSDIASATVASNRQMADYIGIILDGYGGGDAQLSHESVLETMNLGRLESQNGV